MLGDFRAELLKLRKRPTTWVLLAAWLVLFLLFNYALPYASHLTAGTAAGAAGPGALGAALPDQLVGNVLGGVPIFAGAIALIFGALTVGSEYAWGTVKTVLLQRSGRLRVLGGAVLAIATALLAVLLVSFAVGAAVSAAIATVEAQPLDWPGATDVARGLAAGWLVATTWAMFGVGLAVGFRSVAVPVGLGVVWVLGVENLITNAAESLLTALRPLRDVLPGANAGSLVAALTDAGRVGDAPPGVVAAVSSGRATVTLVAYLVGFAVLAAVVLRRRDVA